MSLWRRERMSKHTDIAFFIYTTNCKERPIQFVGASKFRIDKHNLLWNNKTIRDMTREHLLSRLYYYM